MPVTQSVQMVYVISPDDFAERLAVWNAQGARLVSFAPAHGFAGYYYVVLEFENDAE
jgi:hypothetical protein